MPIQTVEATALAELKRDSQWNIEPVIDVNDLQAILDESKTCSIWTASTAYSYGDVVVPTDANQNGRQFKCMGSGTSDSSEPSWATYQNARYTDGSAIWQEAGAQPKSLWDMRYAKFKAWEHKASLVSPDFDFSGSGESYKRSQVFEQCKKQAARFQPVRIA